MDLALKAKLARSFFEKVERDSVMIWKGRDTAPDWISELCRESHTDGMLPDDYCYEYIVDALDLLIEHDGDTDEASGTIEADFRTYDLLQWLASDLRRVCVCDEAVSEYGIDDNEGLLARISAGQLYEKTQIFHSVTNFLEAMDEEEMGVA